MYGQMTIFDWMPQAIPEPDVGEYVENPGAVIPHIMRPSYIGKKVCFDCSTESHSCYKVGILEKIVPSAYWHGGRRIDCDRSVIYTGKKQRSLITHMPGREIFEVLPWEAYQEGAETIGGNRG